MNGFSLVFESAAECLCLIALVGDSGFECRPCVRTRECLFANSDREKGGLGEGRAAAVFQEKDCEAKPPIFNHFFIIMIIMIHRRKIIFRPKTFFSRESRGGVLKFKLTFSVGKLGLFCQTDLFPDGS